MRPIGLSEQRPEAFAGALNELAGGRLANGCSFTLATGATTTTVPTARGVGPGDWVGLMPVTASAALEYGLGTTYILAANITANQFIVTHPSNATADRSYRAVWFATT